MMLEVTSKQYQKDAEQMTSSLSEDWWLDRSALPDRLWARLTVYDDGSSDVLDLDGKLHEFGSREEATDWLSEDEYSPMYDLIEVGELPAATTPPNASSDAELILKMVQHVDGDA
jgi:hypothetical protein